MKLSEYTVETIDKRTRNILKTMNIDIHTQDALTLYVVSVFVLGIQKGEYNKSTPEEQELID